MEPKVDEKNEQENNEEKTIDKRLLSISSAVGISGMHNGVKSFDFNGLYSYFDLEFSNDIFNKIMDDSRLNTNTSSTKEYKVNNNDKSDNECKSWRANKKE